MKIAAISIADYAEATEGMRHDVERLYFRMLLKMYSRELPLPDDDKDNARMFGYDVRTYTTLKKLLVAWPGAVVITDGFIFNDRVSEEVENLKKRRTEAAENGRIGGRSKGDRPKIEERSDEDRPEIGQTSPSISLLNMPKINGLTQPSPSPSPSPEEKKEEERKEELASTNASREEKSADIAADMVASIREWSPTLVNDREAHTWLRSQILIYGKKPTFEAYHKLKTEILTGGIFASKLQGWCVIAKRLQDEAEAKAAAKAKPKQKSDFMKMLEAKSAKYEANRANGEGKANG